MARFSMNTIKNLGIWGDSLLKGIIFDEKEGRYHPSKKSSVKLFEQNFPIQIKNNSRFGCTAPKALENLKRALDKGFAADAVLLEFGGNDCDFDWGEVSKHPDIHHEPHTPYVQFVETMKKMVQLLKKHQITPVLMNLPPIDSERYFNWIASLEGVDGDRVLYWLKEKNIIYRQQELYSRAIEKLAYREGLPLIDVRSPFLQQHDYCNYLCVDGIHLNELGQKRMSEVFSSYAKEYAIA